MLLVEVKRLFPSSKGEAFELNAKFVAERGINILFGASGSGKSSTFGLIAGTIKPDWGTIKTEDFTFFDSRNFIDVPIQKRSIGMVFQDLALFEHLNVYENIAYGLGSFSRKEKVRKVGEMLERFRIGHLEKEYPQKLSGGERQRVALARALVIKPRLLLLDEPFSALDSITKENAANLLLEVSTSLSIPILLITHDRLEAVSLGQKLFVFEKGVVIASGSPLEILRSPRNLAVASLVGIENILTGTIEERSEEKGTMKVRIRGTVLEVPISNQTDQKASIGISAHDILLATSEPQKTSARNILQGKVIKIVERETNLYVTVDCGAELTTIITRQAAKDMELKTGEYVWLAIKAHSCYFLNIHKDD